MNDTIKQLIAAVLFIALGMAAGVSVDIIVRQNEVEVVVENNAATSAIELSEEQVPATIETEDGEVEVIEAPTVESVEGDQKVEECPEGEEDCGLGLFIYAPTETPTAFKNYTLGHCYNTDGAWGGQCWDLADMFWQNYAGRRFSTCGTGAAKGSWNCRGYNAGSEFALVYDATQLQAGDWVIFGAGTYGHVGMALGGYNNGYVSLLGQNQGGVACDGGGSATNIINISLKSFVGAFRPKTYIKPEPQPEPQPQPQPQPANDEVSYTYKKGDTFGAVVRKLGLATSKGLWGADGDVAYYNKQLLEQGLVTYRNGNYWGNIPVGTTITLRKRA